MNLSAILKSVALLAAVIGICRQAPTPAKQSVTECNRRFIADAFAKWSAGGSTFFEDVLAPEVVWTIKGTTPVAGQYAGRDVFIAKAVTPFAARLAHPVLPIIKDMWAERDDVVVRWDGDAVAKDGQAYHNSYIWIFRMKNMRAIEVVAFLDPVPYDDVINRIPLLSLSLSGNP